MAEGSDENRKKPTKHGFPLLKPVLIQPRAGLPKGSTKTDALKGLDGEIAEKVVNPSPAMLRAIAVMGMVSQVTRLQNKRIETPGRTVNCAQLDENLLA